MGLIEPDFRDRVRYTLRHREYGSLVIVEPEGWENDDKEIARHEEYHGMFTKFSNSLKFVLDGAEFIINVDAIWGVNADIQLIKEERNGQTDIWERIYDGFLDLSTLEVEDGKASVKFNNSGIEAILKARESEKVEIDRLDSIDGEPISKLAIKTVELKGRRIFKFSRLENSTTPYFQENGTVPYISPTLKKIVDSDPAVTSTFEHSSGGYFVPYYPGDSTRTVPEMQQFFYFKNDIRKQIGLTFTIDLKVGFNTTVLNRQFIKIKIQKSKVTDDGIEPVELRDIIYLSGNGSSNMQQLTYTNEPHPFLFDLEEDECLAVIWEIPTNVQPNLGNGFQIKTHDLKVTENSFFEPTSSKFLFAHELGSRLVEIMTGSNNAFYSKALGRTDIGYQKDGSASTLAMTHGFWVRGFDKLPEDDENNFKPLTTTFKDFRESLATVWNLGIGVERIGFVERVRMEELSYFYQKTVTVRLPFQVKKVKRTTAEKEYYSGVEIGYEKGGEYDEVMGLDEYNARSTFTTVIRRIKNTFNQTSKYRADSYGKEFARRKPKTNFPTEDTSYDNDVFLMDLKKNLGVYEERLWQDDFETEPTGVYSPETATNLRLSPFNLMLRHGWVLAAGFTKYLTDYVRYASSTANSKLKTKQYGKPEYSENGNIINSELGRPRYVPMYIEFEHLVDSELMKQIEGFTNINGEDVPNYYGLFEFINENNELEKGYLISLKPNGEGKWKLIKAYR